MGVGAQRRGRSGEPPGLGDAGGGHARPSCKRSAVGLTGTAPSSFMQERRPPSPRGAGWCVGQNPPKSPVKTWVSPLCAHFASRREPRAGANSGRWFSHRSIWGRRVRMFASYFQMLENTLPQGPGGAELRARGCGGESGGRARAPASAAPWCTERGDPHACPGGRQAGPPRRGTDLQVPQEDGGGGGRRTDRGTGTDTGQSTLQPGGDRSRWRVPGVRGTALPGGLRTLREDQPEGEAWGEHVSSGGNPGRLGARLPQGPAAWSPAQRPPWALSGRRGQPAQRPGWGLRGLCARGVR